MRAALSKQRLSSSALFTGAEARSPRRVFRLAAPSWASRRFALSVALRFGSAEVKLRGCRAGGVSEVMRTFRRSGEAHCEMVISQQCRACAQPPFCVRINAAQAYRQSNPELAAASAHSYLQRQPRTSPSEEFQVFSGSIKSQSFPASARRRGAPRQAQRYAAASDSPCPGPDRRNHPKMTAGDVRPLRPPHSYRLREWLRQRGLRGVVPLYQLLQMFGGDRFAVPGV